MTEAKKFTLFMILVFIKACLWLVFIPVFQAPDEISHFAYVQKLAEEKKFFDPRVAKINSLELIKVAEILNFNWGEKHPVWQGYPNNWQTELKKIPQSFRKTFISREQRAAKNPVLYYWFGSFFYRIFYTFDFLWRFLSVRFYSLILSLLTVLVSYKTAKLFFKEVHWRFVSVSLIAFQPLFSFIGVSINNDNLAILMATLFVFFGFKVLISGKKGDIFKILLVVLISLWVKPQLLVLIFVLPLIFKRKIKKGILFSFFLFFMILLISYFLSHNKQIESFWGKLRYQLGFNFYFTQVDFFSESFSANLFNKVIVYLKIAKETYFHYLFAWFWGVFGWLEAVMPLWVYRILKIFCFSALVGLIKWFLLMKKKKQLLNQVWFLLVLVVVFSLGILLNDFKVFATTGEPFGIQGRYFLPLLLPLMLLLTLGIKILIPTKFQKKIAVVLIMGNLFLNLIGFLSMYRYFYG